MAIVCERCGIGGQEPFGTCDWCGAPHRPRLPVWVMGRRWVVRTRLAREARRAGAVASGVTVGVGLHLLVTAFAVAFHLSTLWQSGFLWSQQWWWALVPETWQPWLFSALVGIAYGALAGLVAGTETAAGVRHRPLAPSPATVTALVAFIVSGWDPDARMQDRLIAALLAAAIGRLTTLVWRGAKRRGG